MSSGEEGGTKIQRRSSSPPQHQQQPQMDPREAQEHAMQQQAYQQQMYEQQAYQQQPPLGPTQMAINKKSAPSRFIDYNSLKFKYAVIVTVVFLLLNSKIVWSQIIKLPFMGTMEPSIIALIINSILAGIVFYFISNMV